MKWVVATFVALFGVGILVLGIVALRNGDTWDTRGYSGRSARMVTPTGAVLFGALLAMAATYFIVSSIRNNDER